VEKIICIKLKKQDAAVHRIIQMDMKIVTMKMGETRLRKRVGETANKRVITWLDSTEEIAINLIAWKS